MCLDIHNVFRHTQCVFDQFGKALHIYSSDSEAKSDLLRIKPEIRRTAFLPCV